MIGHAREQCKRLYLEAPSQSSITKGQTTLFICFKTSIFQSVWLHHRRIGHPSYSVVKSMFSSLSQGLDVENFHCDVCELAKHNHVPFLTSKKKLCSFLFHSLGPSTIPNVFEAICFVSSIDDCTRVAFFFLLK